MKFLILFFALGCSANQSQDDWHVVLDERMYFNIVWFGQGYKCA